MEDFCRCLHDSYRLKLDFAPELVELRAERGMPDPLLETDYRLVTRMFDIAPGDYKKFLDSLRTHHRHLPFKEHWQ
jgi:hypothetical protein